MKTFMKVVLLLTLPPVGLAWVIWDILSAGDEEREQKEKERDEILKRATVALEKNAPVVEEVPFWRAK